MSFILIGLLLILSVYPVFAAPYTDFESYSSFNAGGNPVWNDGETADDYWIGEWDSGAVMTESQIAVEDGTGYEGSKGLAIWEDGNNANQGLYLFATAGNGITTDHSGTKYLRVWMDLTKVGFRKANFGVTDSNYNLFTTDEENANNTEWPFYYMADGTTTWETMYHGGDGCFGDAQDSDVYEFKGFFAFPVEDFVIRKNAANRSGLADNTSADISDVTGVYLFWDYSDIFLDCLGEKFYIDNLEFVTDYTVFDGIFYEEPEVEVVEDATPAAVEADTAPVTTAPAVTTTAPQTFDGGITLAAAALAVSALTAKIIKKRK